MRFAMLVGEHHKTRWEVAFYADKLCISPVYLTKVVLEVNGQSAHEMIADYVVIEIKTLLRDARLDIKAVARRAGFANQSSLSRFSACIRACLPRNTAVRSTLQDKLLFRPRFRNPVSCKPVR